jgi:hypothetical protein
MRRVHCLIALSRRFNFSASTAACADSQYAYGRSVDDEHVIHELPHRKHKGFILGRYNDAFFDWVCLSSAKFETSLDKFRFDYMHYWMWEEERDIQLRVRSRHQAL